MFRRPIRGTLGTGGGSSSLSRFDQLITSVPVKQAVQSDLGITLATGVSVWADQSGNGKDFTNGTGSSQPSYGSSFLNGIPVLTFDGVNDVLASSLVTPAPGTTPTYACMVARWITWANGGVILGDLQTGSNFPRLVAGITSTPTIRSFNGTGQNNSGMTVGSWFFCEFYWSNSTSDVTNVGSTLVTGTNTGNLYTSVGRTIGGASHTAAVFGNIEVAQCLHTAGLPNGSERSALRALVTAKYGAGVGV